MWSTAILPFGYTSSLVNGKKHDLAPKQKRVKPPIICWSKQSPGKLLLDPRRCQSSVQEDTSCREATVSCVRGMATSQKQQRNEKTEAILK